jgi:hypothetical protein
MCIYQTYVHKNEYVYIPQYIYQNTYMHTDIYAVYMYIPIYIHTRYQIDFNLAICLGIFLLLFFY